MNLLRAIFCMILEGFLNFFGWLEQKNLFELFVLAAFITGLFIGFLILGHIFQPH